MKENGNFYARLRYYVEPSYEITDPKAEITPDQLRQFFDRCTQLYSPLELETDLIEKRQELAAFFSDDELVDLTHLSSADFYDIFSSQVNLYANEPLTVPETHVALHVITYGDSDIGPVLKERHLQSFEATLDTESGCLSSGYHERTTTVDKEKLRIITNLFREVMGMPPATGDRLPIQEIIRRRAPEDIPSFTQARWLEAMLLLDMIAILKELGLTSTDDLNW